MNFSVLMSLYYKEDKDFLNDCFDSIWIRQSVKPTEIVLVLDGPIGVELESCIERWKETIGEQLKIIPLEKNVGLGNALNEGLKHCLYEWVFRMDTDDVCVPNRFEQQISFIKNNSEVVLFGGQIIEFNLHPEDGDKLKPVPITNAEIVDFSKKRNPFNHMTVAYRRDLILSLGGYQHHLFMEDYNLWLRVISTGYKVANIVNVLVYARVGNGMHARRRGLTYIRSEKQLLDLKRSLELQSMPSAYMVFILRSVVRFVPSNLLSFIYNKLLRKNS
ncbi:MAG: glycosyltransferase [Pelistega sp.]|nr:glycosyltransferase [Pelistega sp.]